MASLARLGAQDPRLVTLAKDIVSGLPSKAYMQEVGAIFDWVQSNVKYRQDPRWFEWVQYPWYTYEHRAQGADCDAHACFIACLALCLGHGAAFRAIKADPMRPQEFSHVYPLVGWLERGMPVWSALDSTNLGGFMGWEPPEKRVLATLDLVIAEP